MKKASFFLILVTILSSLFKADGKETSIIKEKFPLIIKTPALSHQQRLKVQLPNGLEVLLISDYKTTISGAALVVQSGSWDNPNNHLGLAHLTEHCVFLGSKEYPGISDFSNHLTKHNGSYNAFTSDKATTYLFTINNEGFLEALKQMSSFLKDPLFREHDINREKTAVNEEFSRNKFNDSWRLYRLEQLISDPNHPAHLFSTGNLESLQQTNSQDLQKWFQQHYFAENMKLVIFSSLPLNTLIENVEKCFLKIPQNSNVPFSLISYPIFDETSKNKLFITKPLIDKSIINLIWVLPQENFKNLSAIKQIAFLFQHNNENGLVDKLKKEHLISSLTSEVYSHKQSIELTISIELTEQGSKEYLNVLTQCFSYLNYLENNNIPEYISHELNTINTLEYEFQDNQNLFSYLYLLSQSLPNEHLSEYPSKEYLLKNDPEINKKILSYLSNPENCRFLFMTNSFSSDLKSSTYYDPIYDLDYQSIPLKIVINKDSSSKLKLPEKNYLLTNSNTYLPLNNEVCSYPFSPENFSSTKSYSLYYANNTYLPSLKTAWNLLISFPNQFSFSKNFVLTDIFSILINDILKDAFSYADAAGLDGSISPSINGLNINISGFSNNMIEFLKTILNKLNTYKFSEKEFINAHNYLLQKYKNAKYESPLYQGLDLLYSHILDDYISYEQKISAINQISWKDFQLFSDQIFKKIFIEAMLLGNLNQTQLSSFKETIRDFIDKRKYYNPHNNQYPHLKKNLSSSQISESSPFDSNVLLLSFSRKNVLPSEIVLNSLLFKSLHTAFFEELRTNQQLGYAVGANLKLISLQSMSGLLFIQSKQYSPEELLKRTTVFLKDFQNNLSNYGISEQSFSSLKNSFIEDLTHPDKSLKEISAYLFDLTFNPYNSHISINDIIEVAKNLSYQDFIEFAKISFNDNENIIYKVFINSGSK